MSMTRRHALAEACRRTRMATSMTQEQLAEKIDVSKNTMQRIESGEGRISAIQLIDIARHCGISVDTIATHMDAIRSTKVN